MGEDDQKKKVVVNPPPTPIVTVSREIIKGMEEPPKINKRELKKGE